jgi:hypothetical protein
MTTSTLDRHQRVVRMAEVAAAAGFQYGLARLLSRAVTSATRIEDVARTSRAPYDDRPTR